MDKSSIQCLFGKELTSCFLVAEAGASHTGLKSAMNLVDIAVDAGFDAVKFQRIDAEKIDSKDEMFGAYCRYDIIKQRCLTEVEWVLLEKYCEDKIFFFTTIAEPTTRWAETYKIASRWLKDLDLIENVSKNCNILQIDTGGASLMDVVKAIDVMKSDCIVHYCPTGYPAKSENLRTIKKYKDMFKCPIAYSSHGREIEPDIMALALGVCMIEKPIIEWESESISPEAEYALLGREAKIWVSKIIRCQTKL